MILRCSSELSLFLVSVLLFQVISFGTSQAAAQIIPDWIKKNADWWVNGLISDKDFAAGLGYMIREGLIVVKNVEFDSQGSIVISDDIQIPQWIQNNARWWVEGAITDEDFKSGIQHMLKEDIISFKERSSYGGFGCGSVEDAESDEHGVDSRIFSDEHCTEESECDSDKAEICKDVITIAFGIQKWNELAILWLTEINQYESDKLQDNADNLWEQYGKTNDSQVMSQASAVETEARVMNAKAQRANDASGVILDAVKRTKQAALDVEVKILDLEKTVKEQQSEIDKIKKIRSDSELENAKDNLRKAQQGGDEQRERLWNTVNGFPTKWEGTGLNAKNNEVTMESMELAHEGLTIVEQSSITDKFKEKELPEDKQTESSGWGKAKISVIAKGGVWMGEDPCRDAGFPINYHWKFNFSPYEYEYTSENSDGQTVVDKAYAYPNIFHDAEGPNIDEHYESMLYETEFVRGTTDKTVPGQYNFYIWGVTTFPGFDPFPKDVYEFEGGSERITVRVPPCIEEGGPTGVIPDQELEPPADEESDVDGMTEVFPIVVLVIYGHDYPIVQFETWRWDGECGDDWHYHTPSDHAIDIELTGISDPDPNNCGYGKVGLIPIDVVYLTQDEIDTLEIAIGLDPRNEQPQIGGEGP